MNEKEENNRQEETSVQEQKLTGKENTFKIILTQPRGEKRRGNAHANDKQKKTEYKTSTNTGSEKK